MVVGGVQIFLIFWPVLTGQEQGILRHLTVIERTASGFLTLSNDDLTSALPSEADIKLRRLLRAGNDPSRHSQFTSTFDAG